MKKEVCRKLKVLVCHSIVSTCADDEICVLCGIVNIVNTGVEVSISVLVLMPVPTSRYLTRWRGWPTRRWCRWRLVPCTVSHSLTVER